MRKVGLAFLLFSCASPPECIPNWTIVGHETSAESSCPEPLSSERVHSLGCDADRSWYDPETCDYVAHGFCAEQASYTMTMTGRKVGERPVMYVTLVFREEQCRTSYTFLASLSGK